MINSLAGQEGKFIPGQLLIVATDQQDQLEAVMSEFSIGANLIVELVDDGVLGRGDGVLPQERIGNPSGNFVSISVLIIRGSVGARKNTSGSTTSE